MANKRKSWDEEHSEVPMVQHLVVRNDDKAIAKLIEVRETIRKGREQREEAQRRAFIRMEQQMIKIALESK